MSELIVGINGMTCGACSASISQALQHKRGISSVDISLITEEGKIVHDKNLIQTNEIINAIEDCGFEAKVIKDKSLTEIILPIEEYETVISIQGMTCASCSSSITESLEKLTGVKSVSISLITEDGKIIHDSTVSTQQIIQSIENCGFEGKLVFINKLGSHINNTKFQIIGMTCGSCSASITKALEKLKGVIEATVSLITEEAMIKHNNDTTVENLKLIIEDCGFDANLISTITSEKDINDDEEVILRIFGLEHSNTNINTIITFEYNLEAMLTSLGHGIISHNLKLDNKLEQTALAPTQSTDEDIEIIDYETGDQDIINELTITYDSSKLGIRDIINSLNSIDENIQFFILNSHDESSNLQLKLLSKVKEIKYWKINFLKSVCLGIPIFILSKTQHMKFWSNAVIFKGLFWTTLFQGILSSYIQFKLGKTFENKFKVFITNKGSNATMDVLVYISTTISFIFSVISVIIGVWNGIENPPKALFETNAMIITYISLGKWIENKAKGATSTALSKLLSLSPNQCTIVTDLNQYENYINLITSEKMLKTDEQLEEQSYPTEVIGFDLIQKGDITIVIPGSNIPADGEIIFGESEIDESLITGESLPSYKKVGDQVIGGSINGPGILHVRITKCGKNSQLQKVIKLVKEGQVNKAPIQRYSDYIAARFVPTVLVLALITFLFWLFFCYLSNDSLPKAFTMEENGRYFVCLKLSISVIVVACPCALGLASPTAIMVGTGLGAKHGALIKGGDVLEKANDLDILLFDKTGTLTTGKMNLNKYEIIERGTKFDNDTWWRLIGSIESNSEHPIGKAIVKIGKNKLGLFEEDLFGPITKTFNSVTGMGAKGEVLYKSKTYELIVGNKKLMEISNIDFTPVESFNTVVYVVIDKEYQGYIELTDEIKPNAKSIINYLKYDKKYIIGMVTGDNNKVAEKVGNELGISKFNIFSEVSPIYKDKIVEELRSKFSNQAKIAFIGDGINDAPALSNADIGIAIANGTDIAIESSDIILMNEKNDLLGVPIALDISIKTFQRIKINFLWAVVYNLIMVPFAMGCFLPFNIMLPPIAASLAMAFSSVSVVISSLLLNKWKPNYNFNEKNYDFENFEDFNLKGFDFDDFIRFKANSKRKHGIRRNGYQLIQ